MILTIFPEIPNSDLESKISKIKTYKACIFGYLKLQKIIHSVDPTQVMIFAQDDQFQVEKSKMLVSRNFGEFWFSEIWWMGTSGKNRICKI